MPDNIKLNDKERACLREARNVMNNVVREMYPESSYGVTFNSQFNNAEGLAVQLGADRYRGCMARPSPQTPARR